jgi:putative Mg2+ transporter-C (MgtC) family protein
MDFCLHLIAATLLGSLIGMERQWHQRFAGLRTNALVAAGAAAFTGAALSQAGGGAPAPMLGQIISGIGFLGAGVIFKEEFNVRGLNTAATIWCSAAVGMLAGLSLLPEAAETAGAVLVINLAFRPLVRMLSERAPGQDSEILTVYTLHCLCGKKQEARLRQLLLRSAGDFQLALKSLHSAAGAGTSLEISAELSMLGRNDRHIEDLASRLSLDASVRSVRWEATKTASPLE